MSTERAIGVDIGGTKIAFALVDDGGAVIQNDKITVAAYPDSAALLDAIAGGIQRLLTASDAPVMGIGLCSPGNVNPVSGVVRHAVNLGWDEIHLVDEIRRRLESDTPLFIAKDANAAALGEKYFGAAQGCDDFVYIAIGTGLGGGVVTGGELVTGADSNAMEIGHLGVIPDGRLCACGLRGCPEMYASGIGLTAGWQAHRGLYPESALAALDSATTADILNAARSGDDLGKHIIDEAVDWLSLVAACNATIFNPELIVIGGGLGIAAADLLIDPVYRETCKRVVSATHENLRFTLCGVRESAVGAASLVWYQTGHR